MPHIILINNYFFLQSFYFAYHLQNQNNVVLCHSPFLQIISKRRIQYLKTQEFDLIPGDLPLKPGDLVEPLEDPPLGTRRGMLNIPITLDNPIHTIAPSARVRE